MRNPPSQEQFRKKLQSLYKAIDKSSNLLWSHENHITGARKARSKQKQTLKWMNKETTQIGYGEISMFSMINLMNLFQNSSILIKNYIERGKLPEKKLKYQNIEEYNMNENSFFLDIGSGFGKPVFHCAYQVGCKSCGVEVVPARVEFCLDFYYEFLDGKDFFKDEKSEDGTKIEEEYKDINSLIVTNNKGFEVLDTKLFNRKKTVDFMTIWLDFEFYNNNLFAKNGNFLKKPISFGSYFEDKKSVLFEICNIFTYANNDKYIKYKLNQTHSLSLLAPEDHNIRLDKKLIYISRVTFISNHKFTSLLSNIIADNLSSNLPGYASYSVFPTYQYFPSNIHLLDLLYFTNEFLTTFTINNSSNVIDKIMMLYDLQKQEENYENNNNCTNEDLNNLMHQTLNNLKFIKHNPLFYKNISFLSKDATKDKKYTYLDTSIDFTHIYSYNKLMSDKCRKKISSILNKTNWKILAWYSNENQTKKSGLKHYFLIAKFPMSSTSTEKFYCYVYIKIK